MPVRKTTIYLPAPLQRSLREAAARRECSVNDLLLEGAARVLDAETQQRDAATLRRGAADAWDRLRDGLYAGEPFSHRIDEVVYGLAAREAAPEYGTRPARKRPAKRRRAP
jgi:hypothetical protein